MQGQQGERPIAIRIDLIEKGHALGSKQLVVASVIKHNGVTVNLCPVVVTNEYSVNFGRTELVCSLGYDCFQRTCIM